MECTYVNGLIEGKMTRWNINGLLERVEYYTNNLRNGRSNVYFENGVVFTEEDYVNDTLNGNYTERHPNGIIKVSGKFRKGLYDGNWKYYDDKGIIVGEGKFSMGEGVLYGYYWNGKMKREVPYVKNEKDGKEIWYCEDGTVEKEVLYENGRVVGTDNKEIRD